MTDTPDAIRAAVEQRFAQVARSPDQERKFPVGPTSAKNLGYDPQEIDSLPPAVTESFCGVGNPLGLGKVQPPDKGILSRTLYNDDRLKVVLFGFAQGDELSEHTARC